MSKREKLVKKFMAKPLRKDLTFNELEKLFTMLGYTKREGRGSRVRFSNRETGDVFTIHKPHPENILKSYVVKEVYEKLKGLKK
ncbi:MAG: type II toxin-antitoxin system HicA family toxin [bacterium]|nr:type II toxin-antitoxin system HicA family toxin [bacterium]